MADYDIAMVRVFLLVYETRSVTAAAERLFVSQPSVSYTLRKLRLLLTDDLFVRRGNELAPTEVADELYPRLRALIGSMDEIMADAAKFKPEESTRRFHLRLTDVGVNGLLPRILRRVREKAPHVVIDVGALSFSTVVQELRLGLADAAICATRLDAPDLLREPLFRQRYLGVAAVDHPRIQGNPTLAQFEAEEHVDVAAETGHRAFEAKVESEGISRRVALVLPSFSALPAVLSGTELLAFAPANVAQRFARGGLLRAFDLPFDVQASESALYTMRRKLPSAELDWLRGELIDALQEDPALDSAPR